MTCNSSKVSDGCQSHSTPESSCVQIAATLEAPAASARTQVTRCPAGTAFFNAPAAISGRQSQVSQGTDRSGRMNHTAASLFVPGIGSTRTARGCVRRP